jgi:hypothetical protein
MINKGDTSSSSSVKFLQFTNSDNQETAALELDSKGWVLTSKPGKVLFDRIKFLKVGWEYKTLLLGYKAELGFIKEWSDEQDGRYRRSVGRRSEDILEFSLPECFISEAPKSCKLIVQSRKSPQGVVLLKFWVSIGGKSWGLITQSEGELVFSDTVSSKFANAVPVIKEYNGEFVINYGRRMGQLAVTLNFPLGGGDQLDISYATFEQSHSVESVKESVNSRDLLRASIRATARFLYPIQACWNSVVNASKNCVAITQRGNRASFSPVFTEFTHCHVVDTTYSVEFGNPDKPWLESHRIYCTDCIPKSTPNSKGFGSAWLKLLWGGDGSSEKTVAKFDTDPFSDPIGLHADGLFWIARIAKATANESYDLIDGSLCMKAEGEFSKVVGSLSLSFANKTTGEPVYLWQLSISNSAVNLSFSVRGLRIPLDRVLPAVADRFWEEQYLPRESTMLDSGGVGFQTEMPIVIPLKQKLEATKNQTEKTPNFLLVVNESIGPLQSLRTDLEIERLDNSDETSDDPQTFIVLQREPQIVAAVTAKLFAGKGNDTANTVIARKTILSDQPGAWEFLIDRSVDSSFLLTLPAQGLGEELLISNEYNSENTGNNAPGNRVFESRFTAPTQIRLEPSVLERRYVPALWNLSRLWGRPGDLEPGVPIKEAIFELLYGLEGKLEVDGLRMAELASKLGQVPPPSSIALPWEYASEEQKRKRTEFWNTYRELYLAWIRRIAVIEPWKDAADASLKIDQGLNYRARVGLPRAAETLGSNLPRGAQLAWPAFPDNEATDQEKRLHNKNGLKGGFHVGVPSYPIYKELMRDWHQSSSAEATGLAFSSVGGYGKQTVRFSRDKSVIQSDTRAGRTNFYAFERIGRIGCLFNKAKYVVLCEREVGPSEQFASQQKGTEGRVLLRKVAEFIEILEPIRKYPDFEGVSVQSADQVRASYFPGTIIPVQASWGRNVYSNDSNSDGPNDGAVKKTIIGWEIPLWQVGADPDIYPRPQAQLGIATDGSTNASLDFKNCLHPERIYFYTSIKTDDGSDTNQWSPVEGPDFTDLPFPKPIRSQAPYRSKDQLDSPLGAPVAVPPGFERFTFELEDSGVRSTIAGAYYPNSNMTGSLRTVSMMRSREGSTSRGTKAKDESLVSALTRILNQNSYESDSPEDISGKLIDYWRDRIVSEINSKLASINLEFRNLPGNLSKELLMEDEPFWLARQKAAKPFWLARQKAALIELVVARLHSCKQLVNTEIESSKSAVKQRLSDKDTEIKRIINLALSTLNASVGDLDAVRTDLHRFIDRVIDQGILTIHTIERSFSANVKSIETKAKEISALAIWIRDNIQRIRLPSISTQDLKLEIKEDAITDPTVHAFANTIKEIADLNGNDFSYYRTQIGDLTKNASSVVEAMEKQRSLLHSTVRKHRFVNVKSAFATEEDVGDWIGKLWEGSSSDADSTWKDFSTKFLNDFLGTFEGVSTLVVENDVLERLSGKFDDHLVYSLNGIEGELGAYLEAARKSDLARHFGEVAGKAVELVRQFEGVGSLLTGSKQEASKVLSNFRTVWDQVAAPGLQFNRESLARIVQFDPENIEERLAITPCIAKVRELGDQLEGMGLRLPTFGITDQLIPACESYFKGLVDEKFLLSKFDFSAILSDIGGIKLEKLFPDFKMPDWAHDKVKVTHGFDRTKLNAWVNAESDIKLEKEQKMFDFEAIRIDLIDGRFFAVARIETDGAGERKAARGEITGSLRVGIQGQEVILFRDVRIAFDEGKPDVKIDPSKIEMPGILKQLSDITSNLEEYLTLEETPGFSISPLMENLHGISVPVGVKAKLNLGPFDFGAGTSSVSGMFVGALFQLNALTIERDKPRLDFALTLGFNLGTDKQPFNIAIFLLGGGGVFDIFVKYKPQSNYILCRMKLKVQASACFNVSWGPFKGNIQGAYQLDALIERGEGAIEDIPVTCTMRNFGTVDVGGIASIYIEQAFGVTYQKAKESSGAELRAFGRLEATIRVSRFFSRTFKYNVSQKLATISSKLRKANDWKANAQDFLGHF